MQNIIQTILHNFVQSYPQPGQPAQLELTVVTHDPDRDTSKFRLSDAGKCRLMRFYKRQGKPATNTLTPDVLLQMQAGNLLHAYIERAAQEMGYLVASEEKLEDEHRIGHFDMIVRNPQDEDEQILYDIKTITNKKAYYMLKNGNQADAQHVAQVVSYASMYPGDIDDLCIAYVIRDTMEIQEVRLSMAENINDVSADWTFLFSAWSTQTPPAANPQSWECKYCPYTQDCPQRR